MLADMRERLKQLTAATALVLVAGGSLVACSDENDPKADSAGEAGGGTLTQANFFDEVMQAQAKAGTSHVEMSTNIAGQDVKSEGDIGIGKTPADTAMAMTMKTGQAGLGSIEMRLVDEVFYLNFGPMTKNKFTKIDLNDKNNPIGKQYGELVGNLDPASQFKQFEGAVSKFDQKGKAVTLDGVKAQPYEIVIDTSKLSATEKAAGNSLPKTLEYTMYIGPDNLPRRVTSKLPGAAGGGTMTVDYSKWGEEVSITKPKASEITDKDLLGQLGGANPEGS
jgi:hypothetical protein